MTRPSTVRTRHWQVKPAVPDDVRRRLSDFHPAVLQILYNRNLHDPAHIQAFLEKRYLESVDPFLLKDMDKAVARIQRAIEQEEAIIVYGDFDADGVTATVLLVETLRGLGLGRQQVQPYIPDRVDEGYGLNKEALTNLKAKGAGLVISVDCGIRSVAEVVHARDLGLDMIVTDHHSLGPELPPAVAVINPRRPDSTYPETRLAGVGIAYKVAQALCQALPERVQFEPESLLDLVAIGTVADITPLLGENRQLVTAGLRVLNECRRPGLAALAKSAGLKPGNMTAESIGFGLAPRLNAAGRLAHAYSAAKLLSANNAPQAGELALELERLNQQRQKLTAEMSRQAEELIEPGATLLMAARPDFNPGVVGLVASYLAEKHYRPAIVIEQGAEKSRGSCRSIPEFHVTRALDQVGDLLERYGGHAQAAGFTVQNENLPIFQQRMAEIANSQLAGLDLQPALVIDVELPLGDVDWAFWGKLAELEPTGEGNPTPVFASRGVRVYNYRPVGADQSHLKLMVGQGRQAFDAIAFRQGAWAGHLPEKIDIAYTVGVNEWNGRRTLQLTVQDIQLPTP
ncbi:MAG: single-stranded-DNA-specific exonuclease RecJ [Chloroflexota bacterium]